MSCEWSTVDLESGCEATIDIEIELWFKFVKNTLCIPCVRLIS